MDIFVDDEFYLGICFLVVFELVGVYVFVVIWKNLGIQKEVRKENDQRFFKWNEIILLCLGKVFKYVEVCLFIEVFVDEECEEVYVRLKVKNVFVLLIIF